MSKGETRYVSVAWKMWNNHPFLVPYLNGEPYSHKPPLPVMESFQPEELLTVAEKNLQTLFISDQPAWEHRLPEGSIICYSQEFRGKDLLIWKFH